MRRWFGKLQTSLTCRTIHSLNAVMKFFPVLFGVLVSALSAAPEGEALKAHLQKQQFVSAPDGNNSEIKFEGDKIEMQVFGPGGIACSGTFSVSGKTIQIKLSAAQANNECAINTDKCTFLKTPDSPVAIEALRCGKDLFFNQNKAPQPGKTIQIDGTAAIISKPVKSELTTAAVFRKKPAKSGAAIKCQFVTADMSGTAKPGLPPGFTVYARTKEKVKVDKWENYWYYVFSPSYDTQICDSPFGWVFAEFVRPSK